jgi:hypothetical protein
MKNFFLYNLIFVMFLTSCRGNSNNDKVKFQPELASVNSKSENKDVYREIKFDNKKSDYSDNSEVKVLDLNYGKSVFKFRFLEDKTFLAIDHHKKEMMNWSIIQFNSNYDIDLPTAEKSIHFLSNGESDFKGYFLFPAPTEEFPSFYLYQFDGKTMIFKGFYASKKMSASEFSYHESKQILMQIDSGKDIPLEFISNQPDLPEFSEDDLKKIQASATKKSSNQLNDLIASNQFLVKEFDVNKDGVSDKILSHLPYQGDQLLIFLSDKKSGDLKLALETTNFSEDGGNQVTDIRPSKSGFEIITDFPDRGKYENTYQIEYNENSFWLKKLSTESYSYQNQTTEFCNRELNINLNSDLKKIFQVIESAKPICKTVKQ